MCGCPAAGMSRESIASFAENRNGRQGDFRATPPDRSGELRPPEFCAFQGNLRTGGVLGAPGELPPRAGSRIRRRGGAGPVGWRGRSFVLVAAAFAAATICAASVEIYPGPGIDTYKSTLYTVEVFDGSNWLPAYVHGFTRLSQCHWHYGTYPTANFLTFGTTGSVDVRVTKLGGSITSVDASPHSKSIPVSISGGKAVLTLNQNVKAGGTINADHTDPLFIFAHAPT